MQIFNGACDDCDTMYHGWSFHICFNKNFYFPFASWYFSPHNSCCESSIAECGRILPHLLDITLRFLKILLHILPDSARVLSNPHTTKSGLLHCKLAGSNSSWLQKHLICIYHWTTFLFWDSLSHRQSGAGSIGLAVSIKRWHLRIKIHEYLFHISLNIF